MKACERGTFFLLKVYERGTFSVKMVYTRVRGWPSPYRTFVPLFPFVKDTSQTR